LVKVSTSAPLLDAIKKMHAKNDRSVFFIKNIL
jgi:hypothetical protein